MKIYIVSITANEYKKSYIQCKTGSKIKCNLIKNRLLKQGNIVRVTCFRYPNILQYESNYYPN